MLLGFCNSFFGVLEIPIPWELVQEDNTISVELEDDGGHISTVTMQVFEFSKPLERTEFNKSMAVDLDYGTTVSETEKPESHSSTESFTTETQLVEINLYRGISVLLIFGAIIWIIFKMKRNKP